MPGARLTCGCSYAPGGNGGRVFSAGGPAERRIATVERITRLAGIRRRRAARVPNGNRLRRRHTSGGSPRKWSDSHAESAEFTTAGTAER
jgi:hypothetical protein